MLKAPIPQDEAARVRALHELLVLDTDPEDRFDIITGYCRSRFGVTMALVSLVDTSRQWFKSAQGLECTELPRESSFCGHAIMSADPLVVPNTAKDVRFADNPLVTGEPHLGFYAGIPLQLSSGHRVGTLCLLDKHPRELAHEDLVDLRDLARLVVMELEADSAKKREAAEKHRTQLLGLAHQEN